MAMSDQKSPARQTDPLTLARALVKILSEQDPEMVAAQLAEDKTLLRGVFQLSGRLLQSAHGSGTPADVAGCCMIDIGAPLKLCKSGISEADCLGSYPGADWMVGPCNSPNCE